MILLGFGKTSINGKQFTMEDSAGTVYLSSLGLDDTFCGGSVKEFRKTKYGIYLCLDKKQNIINLGYNEDELTTEGLKLLLGKDDISENEPPKTKGEERKELITRAKELGVEGKIATMKTDELKSKIEERQRGVKQ